MLNYVWIAAAVYVGLLCLLFIFQRSLLYHPSSSGSLNPAAYGLPGMTRVQIQTQDRLTLEAWYRGAEDGKQTILYLHGNAGHIGHRAGKVKHYLDAGYGVLLLSYRGYGPNAGKPTEDNLYIDGRAALKFLNDRNIPLSRTVVYGESLGTGVGVELARNRPVNCLVLEAPFSSITEVAGHHYFYLPVSLLVKDRFDSINKINEVTSPVYFIHGERDKIIPWRFGKRLYLTASEPKELLLIPDASHNNIYEYGAAPKIIDFIQKWNYFR